MDSDALADHMAENKVNEKPSKTSHSIGENILQCFSKLSNPSEKCKDAAILILKHLVLKQGSENEVCSELLYAVKRLISGMGSHRLDARTNFYSTFVMLLSTFPQITISIVLDIAGKSLATSSTQAKSEKAELYNAQILLCGALIQSKVFLSASAQEQQLILTNVLETCEKRSYLPVAGYTFLKELVEQVNEKHFKKILWPVLQQKLLVPWPQQTLDTLYLLLVVRSLFPSVITGDILQEHLEAPDVLHESSLQVCGQLIMSIPRRNSIYHPVYEELCKCVCASQLCVEFWRDTVDAHLSKEKVNKVKEIAAARVFQLILTHLTNTEQVPDLFSPHFVELLMRSGQKKRGQKDEVFEMLEQGLDLVVKKFDNPPSSEQDPIIFKIIENLLFYPRDFRFELLTNYRIVRQLTSKLDSKGVKMLSKTYHNVLKALKPKICGFSNETERWSNKDRVFAAQAISRLMSHAAMPTSLTWKAKQLILLLEYGFFKVDGVPQPVAAQIKDAFYKSLDQRATKLESLTKLLGSVVSHLHSVLSTSQRDALWQPLPKKSWLTWSEMVRVTKQLEEMESDTKSAMPLFHIMFLHIGLQLFSDTKMAEEVLQELHSCFKRVQNTSKRKQKKALREGELEDEEPEWVEVAVDLLLSLLSHNSHLLRTLVMSVFPHLCPHLTASALQQILNVLDPKSGVNLLSVQKKDTDEESSSDSDESEDEDMEKNYGENEHDNDDDEDDEDEDDEDDDIWDDDDNEKETVNDKLRMAVRQALGTAASLTDTESVDLDDIDEEEGKRLNMALSNAFKALKDTKTTAKSKAKQSKEDEALTHFRTRVLDLLEILLNTEPAMGTCFELIIPLFELLEFCMHDAHQKPLENKLRSFFRKLSGVTAWHETDGTSHGQLITILHWLLDKGDRTAPIYLDMAKERAMCCTFLLRCSIHLSDRAGSKKVLQIYRNALEDFLKKRDCLFSIVLFRNALNLMWEGKWVLVSNMIPLVFSPDVRSFSQLQALQLLKAFFTNRRHFQEDKGKDSLVSISSQLVHLSHQVFASLASGSEGRPKSNYLVELLGVLKVVRQVQGDGLPSEWGKLGEVLGVCYEEVDLGAGVISAIRALSQLIGIKLNKTKYKPKKPVVTNGDILQSNSESEADVESSKTGLKSKKKKSRSKDTSIEHDNKVNISNEDHPHKTKKTKPNKKLKKESQALRQAAMSEGLEPVTFNYKTELNDLDAPTVNRKKSNKRKLGAANSDRDHKKKK